MYNETVAATPPPPQAKPRDTHSGVIWTWQQGEGPGTHITDKSFGQSGQGRHPVISPGRGSSPRLWLSLPQPRPQSASNSPPVCLAVLALQPSPRLTERTCQSQALSRPPSERPPSPPPVGFPSGLRPLPAPRASAGLAPCPATFLSPRACGPLRSAGATHPDARPPNAGLGLLSPLSGARLGVAKASDPF